MPEHVSALIVILGLAVSVFWIAQRVLWPGVIATAEVVRRRNVWFALTLAAFLSHNYWLIHCVSASALWWAGQPARERNPTALFFFLMIAVSGFTVSLSGLGVLQSLFEFTHLQHMTLLVLLLAALRLRKASGTVDLGAIGSTGY